MNDGEIPVPMASPGRRDGEMTLRDLLALLVEHKWVIAAWAAAGLGLAIAVVLFLPAQWEATALVQVGQVGQMGNAGSREALERLTEPPALAQERIKLRSFQDAVLARLQLPMSDSEPKGKLYRNSLTVKLVHNTDLLEIKLRGYSRGDAEIWARATVEQLQEIHRILEQPRIARLKAQLEETRRNLISSEADLAKLMEAASSGKRNDPMGRFAERVLLASLIRDKDAEIRSLRDAKMRADEQLSPAYTHATALLGDITVPEEPVFPNRMLVITLLTLAGLIIGVLAALVRTGQRVAR